MVLKWEIQATGILSTAGLACPGLSPRPITIAVTSNSGRHVHPLVNNFGIPQRGALRCGCTYV